jgi:hypothetical protein
MTTKAQSTKARIQLSKEALAKMKKPTPAEADDISFGIKAGWYTTGAALSVYKGLKTLANGIVNASKDITLGATARINNENEE